MPFLRSRDYPVYIQPNTLNELLQATAEQNNTSTLEVRIDAETDAIEEISEYLQQKYDVSSAFADTLTYSWLDTYYANNLVELTADAWDFIEYTANEQVWYTDNKVYLCLLDTAPAWTASNYTVGQQVIYTDGKYYQCILDTTTDQPPTNTTYWVLIASQAPGNTTYWKLLGWYQQLFYVKYPYPVFNVSYKYPIGSIVFWKGKIYQSIIASQFLSGFASIQLDYTTDVPQPNYFPDDPTNGALQWAEGTPYSFFGISMTTTASPWVSGSYSTYAVVMYKGKLWQCIATPSTTATPGADIVNWQPVTWVSGDNRNRKLVANTIHVTLWNLHNNIAPENIPMLREKNHIRAIKWCEEIKVGNLVVDLLTMPTLQPPAGGRILQGSVPKKNNNW